MKSQMKINIKSLVMFLLLLFVLKGKTSAQEIRWLHIGELQAPINEIGAEYEGEIPSGASINNFFSWPAQYSIDQTILRSKALWIGCRNFDDPLEGRIKSVKVIGSGPRDFPDRPNQIFPVEIKLIGKAEHPKVRVDGIPDQDSYDRADIIDPNLPCDRMVLVKFNTSIGISVTKKVMAFSSSEHGNYFINDYVFKNTGIVDREGTVHQQVLDSVWFYFHYRYAFSGVSCQAFGSTWGHFNTTWGDNVIYHSFGEDPNNPEFTDNGGNPMRGFFSWPGPFEGSPRPPYAEDWGTPKLDDPDAGTLGTAKFAGCITLHADFNAQSKSDDPLQPKTTWFISADGNSMDQNVSQYDESEMQDRYDIMSEGYPLIKHDVLVGNDYPFNYDDPIRQAGGGTSEGQGFGPYTLAPGDSIQIVFAEGVSGISWEKGREVGAKWLQWRNGTGTPALIMPDGSQTTDYNLYKRKWFETGRDSILKTFRNAIENFNSGYNIPQPPPAPNEFNVQSDYDRIRLSWDNNSISASNFNGYVIYRSEGNILDWTTKYKKIFECNKLNVVHFFDDTTVQHGNNYYYFIQSKDDGTTNDVNPGSSLLSSKFSAITSIPASLISIPIGIFRSYQSGYWEDVNTWERFNGSVWEHPAPKIPSFTDTAVTIVNGHTISVAAEDSASQLTIAFGGELIVEKNAVFHIVDKDSTDLIVGGIIKNFGSITKDDSAEIIFGLFNEGKYIHEQDGGVIPTVKWERGSICQLDSVKSLLPQNINQNFRNFVWDCQDQIDDLNLGWNKTVILGNIYIKNTGNGLLSLCSPETDSSANISIRGSLIQSGGKFAVSETNNPGTKIIVSSRDINITGGEFSICKGSQGGTGNTDWYFRGEDFSISNTMVQNSNLANTKFVFSEPGVKTLTLGAGNIINALPIEVTNGVTFRLGNYPLRGSGSFTLDSGATLEVTHAAGIDSTINVSGAATFKNGSNYIFKGGSFQGTGYLLPDTLGSLIINNPDSLKLAKSIVINNLLELKRGKFSSSDNRISYGNNGSLKYSGTPWQITSDVEFPPSKGPKNLFVTNVSGIILHASRNVDQLSTSANILINNNTLSIDSFSVINLYGNPSNEPYMIPNGTGSLKMPVGPWLKLFPIGTQLGYAPVRISDAGNIDTIAVSIAEDFGEPEDGGRVNLKWTINKDKPDTGNYTLQFNWTDAHEDSLFAKTVSSKNWKIYSLLDTTEAGTGTYLRYYNAIRRGGITTLNSFTVGTFTRLTDIETYFSEIPSEFKLKQNYPNPFNPTTIISFDIPVRSKVSLKIFDILGREVTTILSEELSPGHYKRVWNAEGLASGIYFYSLNAGSFIETKKLILIK